MTSLVDAGATLSDLNKLNDTYGASYFDEKGLSVATEITGATGTKGLATFQLPQLSNGRDAKYFIIETTHPEIAKLEMSQPIFLAFSLSKDINIAFCCASASTFCSNKAVRLEPTFLTSLSFSSSGVDK